MMRFRFDGRELTAPDGASVAAGLLGNGITSWRVTRGEGRPRGLFCGIGQCYDCLVEVDGRGTVRACQAVLRDGDEVRTHTVWSSLVPASASRPVIHAADVAIVGAGPGGMAAALAAARAGCRVALVDAGTAAGGQIYRQPGSGASTLPARFRAVTALPGITLLASTTVWHALRDGPWFVLRCSGGEMVTARAVVLAAGAGEVVLPFPGWTLPGVITAGAAQALVKAHGTAPGRRMLVAGSGPLLLRTAADLVRHGTSVAAVCESVSARSLLAAAPAAARHLGKLAEGSRYAATLVRARVPVLSGCSVTSFSGSVVTVSDGRRSRDFTVDAVAVSHGMVPSLELPRALGCRDCDGSVAVGGMQETGTPGVFACGELTGVGGAVKAEYEGTVAGYAAARFLGWVSGVPAVAVRRARTERRFAALLARLYPVSLGSVPPDGTVVCRCEEVTVGDLATAVAAGAGDLRAVKAVTRCGMGYCQGRVCGPAAQLLVARLAGRPVAEAGDLHTRHIGVPVPLDALIAQGSARSGGPA